MRSLLCTAGLLSLLAASASGQHLRQPQDPDVIGVYFGNLEWYENCWDAAFLSHVYAWLVVSNPSQPMQTLDCRLVVEPESYFVADWEMDPAWTNAAEEPDFDCEALEGPIVAEEVILATVDILVLYDGGPIAFYIHPPEGGETPVYGTVSGQTVALTGSMGAPSNPVALINNGLPCYSANESFAWGSVKTLYR